MSAGVSHTESYDLNDTAAIADLALPVDLDEQLRAALDGDHAYWIQDELETAITEQIQKHGVNTDTGEWLGEWSAEQIVRDILARPRD